MDHLHILNGLSTKSTFVKSGIPGDIVIWDALLAEGPLESNPRDDNFWKLRSDFMNGAYQVSSDDYQTKVIFEINKLKDVSSYYEVTLWFEFDLYCQANMLACLAFLRHEKISLVCVGNEDGEPLKGLGQFDADRYPDFFLNRIYLTQEDINYANRAWQAYACDEPALLFPFTRANPRFKYLDEAFKAHLKRFPDVRTGLNEIEIEMLLEISRGVADRRALIGHMLRWQDRYGFGDLQYERILDGLKEFVDLENMQLTEPALNILDYLD